VIKVIHIYIGLFILFICYTCIIYTTPLFSKISHPNTLANAIEGRLVWQKYNCQSCHQLYSLGGYLGPDLTNQLSKENGELILKNIVKNGTGAMPKFELTETEISKLVEFLKMTNESGKADLRQFSPNINGTIDFQ
jgi:nitric oxide reductase subunit C